MNEREIVSLVLIGIALLLTLSTTISLKKGKIRCNFGSHKGTFYRDKEEETPIYWLQIIKNYFVALCFILGGLYTYYFLDK